VEETTRRAVNYVVGTLVGRSESGKKVFVVGELRIGFDRGPGGQGAAEEITQLRKKATKKNYRGGKTSESK